jgi:nitroreductase
MDVFEAIATRRSIRKFAPKPIQEDVLDHILEATRLAPSGANRQPWRYIVVQDAATREKLGHACDEQMFVAEAPVVVVACCYPAPRSSNRGEWMKKYGALLDISIGLDHMQLAAHALGIGSCWIGSFSAEAVRKILGIPKDIWVVGLLPLGYPAEKPAPTPRMPMAEIVCREKWAFIQKGRSGAE